MPEKREGPRMKALRAAFPFTVPILAGFLFLGIAYGIYMRVSGFSAAYPMAMSAVIFGGSMEFVTVSLLQGGFDILGAFILTLMVQARLVFYGLSMLEKYRGTGRKKWYLVFGLCDETFSINCTTPVPDGVDRGWFYFFVTLLNHFYWVLGASLGGLFGSLIQFQAEGLEFVMTALLVVIFLNNWMQETNHSSALIGLGVTLICLVTFGSESFLIPAMAGIIAMLTLLRVKLDVKGGEAA